MLRKDTEQDACGAACTTHALEMPMLDIFPDRPEAAVSPPQRKPSPSPLVLWEVCEQAGGQYSAKYSAQHLSRIWEVRNRALPSPR